eukprot:7026524-Alexandrium_andersonii.AAC.1
MVLPEARRISKRPSPESRLNQPSRSTNCNSEPWRHKTASGAPRTGSRICGDLETVPIPGHAEDVSALWRGADRSLIWPSTGP